MKMSHPIARELLLVGGGHSHVLLLRMLGMKPVPGLKITLVSPESRTPYSGMLPGVIAGHYGVEEAYIDLVPLCRFAGVAFVRDRVIGLDLQNQSVKLASQSPLTKRPDLRYDVLSIDVGITPSLGAISDTTVIPVKPISSFLSRWEMFTERLSGFHLSENHHSENHLSENHSVKKVQDVGFVGAGAGGVELCLAVHHYLKTNHPGKNICLHLFTDEKTILPEFNASVRRKFEKMLGDKGVVVHREFRVASQAGKELVSSAGESVHVDEVFWITQAAPQPWLAEAGLCVDDNGFVRTKDTLQTEKHSNVFAVGDCATMINHPRPRAGVYAVRQGKPLDHNVRALLLGQKLIAYKPQARFLSLISTGDRRAVASRNGLCLQGAWVWRWKNWIDQRFMNRFSQLPEMKREPKNQLLSEFDDQMQCGGCGSKVSADLLEEVLTEMTGIEAPRDDAAVYSVPEGQLLLQTVDHFRSFYDDPYVLARIAVCHALSDIYACGGTPVTAMAMFTLPFAKPDVTRSLLRQVMSGTLNQLEEDGVNLVGGHTSEGMELSLGFAVSGLVSAPLPWLKSGLRKGDSLILTKPLGTGTIFAADMQYQAKGSWVTGALDSMMQSNRGARDVLADYSVSACTDVTGFGLAGHASEMLRGKDFGLCLNLSELPVLAGALECIEGKGITSTLHESNRRGSVVATDGVTTALTGTGEIIFDPQTSGGLLAGVSANEAPACVEALQAAGYSQACVIGSVVDGPGITLL